MSNQSKGMLIAAIILGVLAIIFVTVGALVPALTAIYTGIGIVFGILAVTSFVFFIGWFVTEI